MREKMGLGRRSARCIRLLRQPLTLAGCLLGCLPTAPAYDFSSPVQNVAVTLDGNTVSYQVTDPISGEAKTGSANTPGVVNAPVPSGGVVAWVAGSTVHYRIYDLIRGAWMGGSVDSAGATVVSEPKNHHGVVAWNADTMVYFAVYDPTRGLWMLASRLSGGFVYEVKNLDGVVAWVSGTTTVYYRTYDPVAGQWRGGSVASPGAPSITDLAVADGVAAWSASTDIYCRTYDHAAGTWKDANVSKPGYVTALTITQGTVTWTSGTTNYTRGFNRTNAAWYNGVTLPYAGFVASPSAGNPPLTVWFTDLSLGASAWSWNFGDGGTSSVRTPYHVFHGFARFNVAQTVTGPAGTHATNQPVATDTNAPAGSIVINGGQAHTPSTNVTLTLSAADNSGAVSQMQLSHDGANYSAWEPYATSKSWGLRPGDGLKTVYVRFRDAAANVSAPATDTITLDTTGPPSVSFLTTNLTVAEADAPVIVTVALSRSTVFTSAVHFATSDGTATAGRDYAGTNGVLKFNPGEVAKTFAVRIADDAVTEINETILLTLSNPTNLIVGNAAIITILDDDAPSVAFASGALAVGEDLGEATLTALLSAPSGRTVTVQLAISDGSASAGADYGAVTNRFVFLPGQSSASVRVPILNDSRDELDETVLLQLSAPTNATLGTWSNAVLTLVDEDPPTVSFAASAFFAAENAGQAGIQVQLSTPFTNTIFVDYFTRDGSASVGRDYIAAGNTLLFAPGQTSKTFSVTLLNDGTDEPIETVILLLTNVVVATPGLLLQAVLNLVDNASPPLLYAPVWLWDGSYQFTLAGPAGRTNVIEASSNLVDWVELAGLTNASLTADFRDWTTTNAPRRFYRARRLE